VAYPLVSLIAALAWLGVLAIAAGIWAIAVRAKAVPVAVTLRIAAHASVLALAVVALVALTVLTVPRFNPNLGFWGFITQPYLRLVLHAAVIGLSVDAVLCWVACAAAKRGGKR